MLRAGGQNSSEANMDDLAERCVVVLAGWIVAVFFTGLVLGLLTTWVI